MQSVCYLYSFIVLFAPFIIIFLLDRQGIIQTQHTVFPLQAGLATNFRVQPWPKVLGNPSILRIFYLSGHETYTDGSL